MHEAGTAVAQGNAPSLPAIPSIPLREVVPWAVFAGALMLMLLYLVGMEQGATSIIDGRFMHELVHDARHLLGFPCH